MKTTVLDNKCLGCGANIKFNPKSQKWDCEYCGSTFDENDYKKNIDKIEKSKIEDIILDEYRCPNCGATVITDENTSATFCIYCGNTTVMKNRLQGEFKPNKIIPFSKVKDDAVIAFKAFVKKRWFSPDKFAKEENIQKITGVYIPFWLFDFEIEGMLDLEGKKITSWRSGSYQYTKTDIYNCKREGDMEFVDIPVDGSTKFPDDIMDSIEPYDYSGFKEFNYSYLSGFLSEKYDQTAEEVNDRSILRAENTTVSELSSDMKKYTSYKILSKNIKINKSEIEYALLPVWMMNVLYKGNIHTFAMNGQTGKMIGNVPIDKNKVVKCFLKFFIGLSVISLLITYLLLGF